MRRPKRLLLVFLTVVVVGVTATLAAFAMLPRDAPSAGAVPTEVSVDDFRPDGWAEPVPVAFFGDSNAFGVGATSVGSRWTDVASDRLGWVEINRAIRGTGYFTSADADTCGSPECPSYKGRIDSVAGLLTPEIVVLSGGRNDGADLTAAVVADVVRAAQAEWPDAQIVLATPIWDDDDPPTWFAGAVAAVQEACASTGATCLDLGQPLQGHPEFLAPDGVNANNEGHAAIAEAFASAWSAVETAP